MARELRTHIHGSEIKPGKDTPSQQRGIAAFEPPFGSAGGGPLSHAPARASGSKLDSEPRRTRLEIETEDEETPQPVKITKVD